MKKLFIISGFLLLVVYAFALMSFKKPDTGKIVLRWATDPNPARKVQTKLFGELNPGLEVTVESGAMEKLLVQCATGTGPDIIDIYGATQMDCYAKAGLLLDLTPYASKMGFDPSKTYPSLKEDLCVDGKQYRFPCNTGGNCVIYNKKIFDDHGVEYPKPDWTIEDFIKAGKKFNEPGKSGQTHIPLASFYPYWVFIDMYYSLGGRYYTDDGLKSKLDSPEAIKALQTYHDMMHVYKIIPSPEVVAGMSSQGGWGSGPIVWFSTGKAAMIMIGRWYLNILVNYPDMAQNIASVGLPRFEGHPPSGLLGCRGPGINAQSKHKEQAMKFLSYLASVDYGTLIVRDGDSLPPNPTLAQNGEMLVNKTVSDPAFHQPFVDAMKTARPIDNSPFINALEVQRWIDERLARVENNPGINIEILMKDLATEINNKIKRNIDRSKALQEKYKSVTGKDWKPEK